MRQPLCPAPPFPSLCVVSPDFLFKEQFKCHLGREAQLDSLRENQASVEHLLHAGPWVRLWDIEVHWILALPPEVQGCNPVGRCEEPEVPGDVDGKLRRKGTDNSWWAGSGQARAGLRPQTREHKGQAVSWQSSPAHLSPVG